MIKAVVFDCFGVLMLSSHESIRQKYPDHHDRLLELENQANAGFLSSRQYTDQIAELTDLSPDEVERWLLTEHHLNQQLTQYIQRLRGNGYAIGMLSNLGKGWMQRYVEQPVRDLFDEVVVSGEVGMYKPYPEIYEYMSTQLGLSPHEIFFVDDRAENVEAARMVGLESVQFTTNEQLARDLRQHNIKF